MRNVELPDGQMFAVSDKAILVAERESFIGMFSKIGKVDEDRFGYLFSFKGKLNNKERSGDVTLLMSVEDAFGLASDILSGIDALNAAMGGDSSD